MTKYYPNILLILVLYSTSFWLGASTTIDISGTVLDSNGQPVEGAQVYVDTQVFKTDANGVFLIPSRERKNKLITIANAGYKTEILPLHLSKKENIRHLLLKPVVLATQQQDSVRFVFGGDTSFGRRYIDPDEVTPRNQVPIDNPEALISVSDPVPGSLSVGQYIQPVFQNADWSVLNLETPLTRNPITPHTEKAFAFFTLPESVDALKRMGVGYVSLGNNHLYDYLDIGVQDTITSLDFFGLGHSGAGLNSEQAFKAYHQQLKNTQYSFLSMTSVSGSQHQIDYVAAENKGGAADLRDHDSLTAALKRDLESNFVPIVQLHGGKEYTYEPSENFMKHIQFSVKSGAKLVIGHHPHVAQGIGLIDGVVTVHSLGNLIFDQARLETMLGLVARVDMRADKVDDLRLYPVYIDNYVPKLISGNLANIFLRRIGEFSHAYGGLVYPYINQGWTTFNNKTQAVDRTLLLDVNIPESGVAVVDLRQLANSHESLLAISSANTDLDVQIGRDILTHGDFEDWDVDGTGLAATRWDNSRASSSICSDITFQGMGALCSTRSSSNHADSVISFRNRIRVMGESTGEPNKDISLFGYFRGENAGPISIITRFHASAGGLTFGEEKTMSHPGGSFDWQPFIGDIKMPLDNTEDRKDVENNPRAVRFFIHQSPPAEGDGLARFDDFTVINWEEHLPIADGSTKLTTPHARDFLRIKAEPGNYHLSLKFRRYQPPNSYFVEPDLQANGLDSLVANDKNDLLVTLKLQQHQQDKQAFEWWVFATNDFDQQFSYVYPQGWTDGKVPATTFPLLNIDKFELFKGKLPKGHYSINFCLDKKVDHLKECAWQDDLAIEVQ